MKRGLFVANDGLSGSGKGTQIPRIAYHLFEKGKFENVLITREPSDSPAGKQAREQRAKDKAEGIPTSEHAVLYADLYTQDTVYHCRTQISPNLESGVHVVTDRYYHSRFAYQVREGVPLEKMLEMTDRPEILVPDITFIYDLPPEVALGRIDKAGREGGRSQLEQLEIMRDLRQRYLKIPEIRPKERVVVVNADQSPEAVFAELKPHLDRLWEERYGKK